MSSLSDDQENENKKPSEKRSSAMFMYVREFLFFFALVFTSYATLFNNLPKVGKPPPAVPFFPTSSIVADYYRGTMGDALQEAMKADVAMIMYYAPWDTESQEARPIFDAVARIYHEEVFFAAISCWSPSSECKQLYSKIRAYPVLVVYTPHGVGLQYRGPLVKGYIIRFLESILRPINRVHSTADVQQLLTKHSGVLVGSFHFEGNLGGRGYYIFYCSALKALERDFNHDIAFTITTNSEDANLLGVQDLPSIRLFLWNETFEFPLDAEYTVDVLTNWIWQKAHHLSKWLSPPGSKSLTLSPYITSRPTLLVFTPGSPLLHTHPVASLVKSLALHYKTCSHTETALMEIMDEASRSVHRNYQRLEMKCLRLRQEEKVRAMETEKLTSTVITIGALNNRSGCNSCPATSSFLGPQLEVCVRPTGSIEANKSFAIRYDTSMWNNEFDDRGPQTLLRRKEQMDCQFVDLINSHNKIYYPKLNPGASKAVDGLACLNNRTLNFVLLDAMQHYQFADGLGVQLMNRSDKTVAIIVDPQDESQFVLNGSVTEASLSSFIKKYAYKEGERHLRTSEEPTDEDWGCHSYSVRPQSECVHSDTEACIIELNSANFLETVLDPTKAVIVLYHTPFCALCRSIAHTFLLLARYFRHFPVVKFVRIDGENNDLPWQYTMDNYPSVLFFPVTQKEASRVYSDNLPFTVRSLMQFVLANLEPEAKVAAMFYLCANFEKQQTSEEAKNCKLKVSAQIQDGLSKTLHRMRLVLARLSEVAPNSKLSSALYVTHSKLMISLQYFRSLSFVISAMKRANSASREVLELYLKFQHTTLG